MVVAAMTAVVTGCLEVKGIVHVSQGYWIVLSRLGLVIVGGRCLLRVVGSAFAAFVAKVTPEMEGVVCSLLACEALVKKSDYLYGACAFACAMSVGGSYYVVVSSMCSQKCR